METKKKKNASPSRRTPEQKLADFNFITPLLLEGNTIYSIVKQLTEQTGRKINKSQVANDISKILKEWQAERMEMIDTQKALMIKKIQKVELAAWAGWERSLTVKTKDVTKRGGIVVQGRVANPDYVKQEKHETESAGDPKWLDIILRCQDETAQILGFKNAMQVDIPPTTSPVRNVILSVAPMKRNNDDIELAHEIPQGEGDGTVKLLHS